jgi:hypothetical protein
MIKWRVPDAVAKRTIDVTPRSPSVPMNCTKSDTARTVERFRTGSRQSTRLGTIK